ncbi:hypothetical protein CMV_019543 [Castanea mollissima]|uniref:Protein kinase domain-containing protein n=1 Tax=Castanea mollissima TaxID=60419 RepID=A0A8J4QY93_9ROSI|nr:hypothetical protein CMV_019543 [Castanea mollissima]
MHRYKGSLEGRIVLIKLFPDSKSLADFAINDLVISAQMCAHNNVLKPIGCCLENQPPILVYEFPKNGFLADRIYICSDTRQHQPMAWESKTDVEAYNGLWHPKFKGPEFEAIGKVTEKFDVYHFGVLLMETGEDSYNTIQLIIDEDSSLVEYMHNCAQGYSINEIVDPAILAGEGGASLEQQLQAVLDLA